MSDRKEKKTTSSKKDDDNNWICVQRRRRRPNKRRPPIKRPVQSLSRYGVVYRRATRNWFHQGNTPTKTTSSNRHTALTTTTATSTEATLPPINDALRKADQRLVNQFSEEEKTNALPRVKQQDNSTHLGLQFRNNNNRRYKKPKKNKYHLYASWHYARTHTQDTRDLTKYRSASILAYRMVHLPNGNTDREYLLGEEKRRGWSDFGGCRDSGENDPRRTAAREFSEETKHMIPVPANLTQLAYHRRHVVYLAALPEAASMPPITELCAGRSTESTEKSNYAWVRASHLVKAMRDAKHKRRGLVVVGHQGQQKRTLVFLMKAMVDLLHNIPYKTICPHYEPMVPQKHRPRAYSF